MKLSRNVVLTLALGLSLEACTQKASSPAPAVVPTEKPAEKKASASTLLESLLTQKGSLLALDFHNLGRAEGSTDYFFAELNAVTGISPGKSQTKGVRIDIREGEFKRHTSFLDEAEARTLAAAIPGMVDYAKSIPPGAKRDADTNLKYRTAGDFEIGVGASTSGETWAWLESGSVTGATFRLKPDAFMQVKFLLDEGLHWLSTHQPLVSAEQMSRIPVTPQGVAPGPH